MPEITVTAQIRIGESQITISRTGSQAPSDPSKLGEYAGQIIQQAIDPLLVTERAKSSAAESRAAELTAKLSRLEAKKTEADPQPVAVEYTKPRRGKITE